MAKLVLVNLDMNKNQLLQAVMQAGDAPANPIAGQFYYDSTKKHAYVYNGTAWELMGNVASVVDADFDASSTNAIQNKAVSMGLVKTFDKTIDSTSYTLIGKAFDGTQLTNAVIPAVTTTTAGAMSAADKTKLDGIASGANKVDGLAYTNGTSGVDTTIKSGTTSVATATIPAATDSVYGVVKVDPALKADSTNPVQNKTINSALNILDNKVLSLESDVSSMPADISATSSATTYLLELVDANENSIGEGAVIQQATSTNAGVVRLDTSVTQNGTNPVTGKGIYDYVGDAIAASDAMIFKGTIGTGGTVTVLPTTYKTGWTYRVITAGTYAGQKCEVGDLIIALVDRDGTGNLDSDWTVAQTNIDGAITDIEGTAPILVDGSGTSRTISHADSSVTPGQYGETSNKTLTFGGTFSMPYVGANKTGHFTGDTGQVTITMPNNTASSSSAGLMSVDAYNKLYSLVSSSIRKKTETLTAGSKVLSMIISPEYPAEIINVLVKTPDGKPVIADVTIESSGSNVSVVIAQAYSANLTVTVWYVVTE